LSSAFVTTSFLALQTPVRPYTRPACGRKKTSPARSNLGRAASRCWLQWDAPNSPSKTAPSPSTITTPIKYTHLSSDATHHPKGRPDPLGRFATIHCGQTDRQTDKQVIWHDASRSQWQEYALEIGEILHIFPSGTETMGDRGSKKAYTGPWTAIYMPTKFGCDRSIVVGCRCGMTDRQTEWNDNKAHSL